jgi:hydroxybutyrate-dimer hydrolase
MTKHTLRATGAPCRRAAITAALTLAWGAILCTEPALADAATPNVRPGWLGPVRLTEHRGDDDLLSAGMGASGLQTGVPGYADSNHPTAAELRRQAIYSNYRALVDITTAGGYGSLFGPSVDLSGNPTLGEGLIPGVEYVAYARNVAGVRNVTLMVQVPDSFDTAKPCIVAAPSSGSRGVYGAIATTGEIALKHGCAVAYTDKGTGAGAHELDSDSVTLIDGTLSTADAAGRASYFSAEISDGERSAHSAAHPFRYAMKHAHSGDNPERIWGRATLYAIEFAFYALNQKFGASLPGGGDRHAVLFEPANTLVIAASVSNGGGAVVAAAEEDTTGLIDGVVAVEPQVNVRTNRAVAVQRGARNVANAGAPLYDYTTYANLLQPCAAIAPSNAASPFSLIVPSLAANRCADLAAAGMVTGASTDEQAEDAAVKLVDYGWEPDSALLHASHYSFSVAPAVALTYANAYRRARVLDNLCGFSMATTNAAGAPAAGNPMPLVWGVNNGVPPSGGINLIAEDAANGPIREPLAISQSTGLMDYNWDGAKCLRDLLQDPALREGIEEVEVKGNLRGKPTLMVHGRSDALVPVNFSSRAYLGQNSLKEHGASRLAYIEVTNAQHFEAFLPLAGYDTRFIPLHYYAGKAFELMMAHLTTGAPLPPSQVVHTTPRGGTPGSAPMISVAANLPPIQMNPPAEARVTVQSGKVYVPD